MKTLVIVTHWAPGFHNWGEAVSPVSFLRTWHRHLFKFRLEVKVTDSDRQVEFFTLQRTLVEAISGYFTRTMHGYEFGTMSCEQIAKWLFDAVDVALERKVTIHAVEVWEDGENGSRVEA